MVTRGSCTGAKGSASGLRSMLGEKDKKELRVKMARCIRQVCS